MTRLALSTMLFLAIQIQVAQAQESRSTATPSAGRPEAGIVAPQDSPSNPAATSGDRWRFKQHQGLWWYWLPTNKWVYWTDGKWIPYEQQSYAAFLAARRPQASSYRSGPSQQGNWGAVRYNQYGQPQYPYSQRSSGIRQLGPVPAMGGVRSLPGWGGER
jgi:hypothetical protein